MAGFDWQIPGLREELVIALIKSLPKSYRRNFVPAPNYAQAFLGRAVPLEKPLLDTLIYELRRMTGVTRRSGILELGTNPKPFENDVPRGG